MNRDERQKLSVKRWIDSGGKSCIVACTGYGKTHCAILIIQSFIKRNPQFKTLIVVPTDVLKEQWKRELAKSNLFPFCKVEIINTILQNQYNTDLLILDEVHQYASPKRIKLFELINYKYVLGLTATYERLDGLHKNLISFVPICDTITLNDALKNHWVSDYRNYKVLLNVDMSQYNEYNKKFQHLFAYFNHDFSLVMSLLKSKRKLKIWAKNNLKDEKTVIGYLAAFMKYLKLRKSFVMSHKKKFEIANKILDARNDKKCILFTATVKDAETFKSRALICHSQRKKSENKKIIDEFNLLNVGNIVSPNALRTGVDIKGLSVGIALSCNSSQISSWQSLGRVIRLEEGKVAEFFTLVIQNSVEENWFNIANKNSSYITINEQQLDLILNGKEISTRPKKGPIDIENRF